MGDDQIAFFAPDLLRDRHFIVTGAASGIGAATARMLDRYGAAVTLADIDAQGLGRTAATMGSSAAVVVFDLADEASITTLVERAMASRGRLDGLANIAADVSGATMGADVDVTRMSTALWRHTFEVNLIGTAALISAAMPHLTKAGGAIVNTSSGAAWYGLESFPAYGASKLGLHSLTRHVARVGGPDGVRCNCVVPGWVLTEASARVMSDEDRAQRLAQLCLKRPGTPDDLASTIFFLLSPASAWVTGQVWTVNGGQVFRD